MHCPVAVITLHLHSSPGLTSSAIIQLYLRNLTCFGLCVQACSVTVAHQAKCGCVQACSVAAAHINQIVVVCQHAQLPWHIKQNAVVCKHAQLQQHIKRNVAERAGQHPACQQGFHLTISCCRTVMTAVEPNITASLLVSSTVRVAAMLCSNRLQTSQDHIDHRETKDKKFYSTRCVDLLHGSLVWQSQQQ